MSNTGNTQQIIDYGAAPNDGTGDPLRTAFIKTDENFSNIWQAGPVGSNITIANNTIQNDSTNGNITIKPNGIGVVQVNGSILPDLTQLRDLGSANRRFRSVYFSGNIDTLGNISAGNIDVSGVLDLGGDVTIEGNLTVNGNTVTVNVANLDITDKMIVIANGSPNAQAANGAGITIAGANAIIQYLSDSNAFSFNRAIATDSITTSNINNSTPITVQTNGNVWTFDDSSLRSPAGGKWESAVDTEYFTSGPNGFVNLVSIFEGNLATELFMEHGFIRLLVENGGPSYEWKFNASGNTQFPGDILPLANGTQSLGNETNQWANLWVANNTIYIGGVPLGVSGNVLTVDGQPVLSNDSNTSITTTGNITANYFIGDGSQLTGLPAGYTDANVATFLASFGSNSISTTGNITATRLQNDGNLVIRSNVTGTLRTWTFDTLGDLSLPVGGNISGSGLITGARVSVTGNVDAGNITAGTASVSGNVTAGNISLTGNVVAGSAANITFEAGAYIMTFDTTGNLTTSGANGNITGAYVVSAAVVRTVPTTVSALPLANAVGAGSRAFVTDANTATFGTTISGGAANTVPVYSDGTNWRVG